MTKRFVVWVDNYDEGDGWQIVADFDTEEAANDYIEMLPFTVRAYAEDTVVF